MALIHTRLELIILELFSLGSIENAHLQVGKTIKVTFKGGMVIKEMSQKVLMIPKGKRFNRNLNKKVFILL